MEITKIFRGLVAASLVLFALGTVTSFLEPEFPDAVNAYVEGEAAGPLFGNLDSRPTSHLIVVVASAVAFLIAYLASCIGLLMFKRWARPLFIGVAVVGIVVLPFEGVTLTSPLLSTVETLFSMVDGALLVMLLFDPIKAKFAKQMGTLPIS